MRDDVNPFSGDADRAEIWEILMRRDFEAFVAADWTQVASDFVAAEFAGIDAGRDGNPDKWMLRFPDLDSYRREWVKQAEEFKAVELPGRSKIEFLFRSTSLAPIEITGGRAIAHKKFDGRTSSTTGAEIRLNWQTLYFLRHVDGRWRITGFIGYLPNVAEG